MEFQAFNREYRALNRKQRQAVDAIDGPVMVVAGPGTGKTTILTLRIANILRKTDTPPSAILALTFTESGAHAMRTKLAEIIGSAAYRVRIATFHGFANSVIQDHPESFPRIIGSRPAGEIDQIKILEKIFHAGRFKILRPPGDIFYYVRPALLAIRSLKKEGFNPGQFKIWSEREEKAALRENLPGGALGKRFARNRELAVVFKRYEKEMRARKLYDYEDMIIETLVALGKDEALLAELRENAHYILADEHQDANGSQNKLLELLSSFDEKPNLFIVGDEKQAIYRFQGASLENFLYFSRKFPSVVRITLTESFRSTQTILDASHGVAGKLDGGIGGAGSPADRPRLVARWRTGQKTEPKIVVKSFETEGEEAAAVAAAAENLVRSDETARVAVLYRDNKDAEPIVKALRDRGLRFSVFSDESILGDPDIQNLLCDLEAVNDPGDGEALGKALFADFHRLPVGDTFKLVHFADKRRKNLFEVLTGEKTLAAAELSEPTKFFRFGENLKRFAVEARNERLTDFLDDFLKRSGFTEFLLSKESPLPRLERLSAFYEIARAFGESAGGSRLPDFMSHLKTALAHRVGLGGETRLSDRSAPIVLMTAHRSKGLEFDAVFIVRSDDNRWSNRGTKELFYLPAAGSATEESREGDERRLFYVAMTRARNRVLITHANFKDDGRPVVPSRFIEDIGRDFLDRRAALGRAPKSGPRAARATGARNAQKTADVLRSLFLEEGLTVTALNNFLECPWKYFFRNLVRLPQTPERHQLYGTAIHEALHRFQNEVRRGRPASAGKLLGYFSVALDKLPLAASDYKDLKIRGRSALKKFFSSRRERYDAGIPEMKISGVPVKFGGGEILLRGKIDLFVPTGEDEAFVVDYKTGKPKSRADIQGNTKGSRGDNFRQLVFYKLLAEAARQNEVRVREGAIVFVEPDRKGICRKEVFPLTEGDVAELVKIIKESSEKIYNLSFWNETCGDARCEFCRLAENLKRN